MRHFQRTITAVATAALLAAPILAAAETAVPTLYSEPTVKHYSDDALVNVGSAVVIIKAGSAYTSLEVTDNKLYVSVPSGEAFEVRQSVPYPLENNLGALACDIMHTRQNHLMINGPQELVLYVGGQTCSVGDYGTDNTPVISVGSIVSGETLVEGQDKQLFWTSEGEQLAGVRLRLSLDGGETYPITIAESLINNGYYNWDVPLVETTERARIIIEGYNEGIIKTFSVTDMFKIEGTEPVTEEEPGVSVEPYDYDPEVEVAESNTVDVGVGIEAAASLPSGACTPGVRLKLADSSTVYYCGVDGKRHPFPNLRVHDSWFNGFAGVVTFTPAEMAQVALGANVTYRPGVRLVKITTDPKVYAVAVGGVLRWVETEAAAERLYGADWNKMIDDVPDTFFVDYSIGDSIK